MMFTKAEARAIKRAVDAAIEQNRRCILTVGHGVKPSKDLVRAQAKIISAAASKLDHEWNDDPAPTSRADG
jgi:hypothetical protein